MFVQIYGQGETPMTITSLRPRWTTRSRDDRSLGVGRLARGRGVEVAVVDDHGSALPIGGIGEVACRGDVVMSGYWNNPGATAEALRDGWLYTGDMGSLDARGYLTLRDRIEGRRHQRRLEHLSARGRGGAPGPSRRRGGLRRR